uniref:Uncharacterized protein n=1 Tax=Solanum tuberosum TaxID=4113 RepID=M1DC96_SOLTU
MIIRSSWVQLERVNPRPSPTLSTRESEWAKAEVVLKSGNSVFERNRIDLSVLSLEGNDKIGGEKEQSAYHRVVPRSSTMPPDKPVHDNVEGWCKTATNYTKGRIAKLIGDSD